MADVADPAKLRTPDTLLQWVVFVWGVCGVLLILAQAIVRLSSHALGLLAADLSTTHLAITATWTLFMLYSEGWKGFHKQFSPRVVVRALGLSRSASWRLRLFAPIVAMGLVHGTPRRLRISRTLFAGIVGLVLCVRQLPAPWRGIVDVGVVLGLIAGAISLLSFFAQTIGGRPPPVDPEFPANGPE